MSVECYRIYKLNNGTIRLITGKLMLEICVSYAIIEISNITTIADMIKQLLQQQYIQDVPGGMCQTLGECSLC